jgi:mannan endo-1,4-beta-mannosidase
VILNIVNEWSPWGTATTFWRDSYKTAISTIRNAGFSGAMVIDASAYGQDPNGPILYGQQLISYDPSKNLIFSVHMYSQW